MMARKRRIVLALALAVAGLAPGRSGAQPVEVDLDLVIAVDISASMDRSEFLLQRAGYVQAIGHADFIRAALSGDKRRIALTYVEWSGTDKQNVVVPWRLIDDAASARAFADQLNGEPFAVERGTSISAALAFSAALFPRSGFNPARRVIDISGDGPNNFGPPVTAARDAVVRQGIVINGLPILISPSPIFTAMDLYYSDCVIGGPGAFALPVTSVDEFALAIRRKLIQEVAARPAAPAIIPVAARVPVDCLVGEEARKLYADPYLPGLDN
jgi:Protein of unknown function (DUF1194)